MKQGDTLCAAVRRCDDLILYLQSKWMTAYEKL